MRKLHLGAFDQVVDGWENTDITPHLFVARVPLLPRALKVAGLLTDLRYEQHKQGIYRRLRYLNVTKRFPFPDNTFGAIYTSHMLEHLFPDAAANCVTECFRVLAPGGVFRIAVPDLDRLIASYNSNQPDPFLEEFLEATSAREKNRHHWHYNEVSLKRLLCSVGFPEAHRRSYREGLCPDLDRIEVRPESLFVEALKA